MFDRSRLQAPTVEPGKFIYIHIYIYINKMKTYTRIQTLICIINTFPVRADQTLSELSSEPLTMRSPLNCRHVITCSP